MSIIPIYRVARAPRFLRIWFTGFFICFSSCYPVCVFRERLSFFISLSLRPVRAHSSSIYLTRNITGKCNEKEHRRNHARFGPVRAFGNIKDNDALYRLYENCRRFVQYKANGALCINREHRAFYPFPEIQTGRLKRNAIESQWF